MIATTALAFALVAGGSRPDPATGIEMVTVGEPGNAADTSGLGAVALPYRIATYEVTNTEYVELLNAVAADDTHGLFSDLMTSSDRGGILQLGSPGSFTYAVKPNFEDKPANSFTWLDAARFCNWLHNGKPSGAQTPATTEDGVYDLSLPTHLVARKPGALYYIPTHDEWYKAAYFDPHDPAADGGGTVDYWFYPTRSDVLPIEAQASPTGDVTNPGPNVANSDQGADWNGENGNVTTVGGTEAPGPWGTFDMGGNINEVTETLGTPITGPPLLATRRLRGGDFSNTSSLMGSPAFLAGSLNMLAEGANIGVRVAALQPWYDLGEALAGTLGEPTLGGAGTTVAGAQVTLTLDGALPHAPAVLVIGTTRADLPLAGGTLVPFPTIVIPPMAVDATGQLELSLAWPAALPNQSSLFAQYWIVDSGGVAGLAASNALQITTP